MADGNRRKGFSWDEIDAFAISEKDIAEQKYPEQEIFFLRINGENGPHSSHGPFFLPSIKNLLSSQGALRQIHIRPLEEGYWVPLGEHPLFDRRREQNQRNVEVLSPEKKNLYIDKRGQKEGPFNLKEIHDKLQREELSPTDLVGLEGGTRWMRIFDLHGFDRRNFDQKKLPDLPEWNIFKNSNEEVSQLIQKRKENSTNPMALLAHLEKIRAGKISPPQNEEDHQEEKTKNDDKTFGNHWFFPSTLVFSLGSILIGLLFLLPSKQSLNNAKKSVSLGESPNQRIRPVSSYQKKQGQIGQRASSTPKKKTQKVVRSTPPPPVRRETPSKKSSRNDKKRSLSKQTFDQANYSDYGDYGTVDNPIELDPIDDEDSFEGATVDSEQRESPIRRKRPLKAPALRYPDSIDLQEPTIEFFDEEIEL